MRRQHLLRRFGWLLLSFSTLVITAGIIILLANSTNAASLLFDALVNMSLMLAAVLAGGALGLTMLHEAARLDREELAKANLRRVLHQRAQQPQGMHKPVGR